MHRTLIIFLLILTGGCSSVERLSKSKTTEAEDINFVRAESENKNSKEVDFIIEKGEVLIRSEEGKQKYSFSVKHNKPDTYLISVKSQIGLEGARIYLTKDTLLINDRLNKKVLYGKPGSILKSYGIPSSFIDIILGNIISKTEVRDEKVKEENEDILLIQNIAGRIIESRIGKKEKRVKKCTYLSGTYEEKIELMFSGYFDKRYNIPGSVEVINKKKATYVKIRIYKFTAPWDGKAVFLPGTGYKEEEIK